MNGRAEAGFVIVGANLAGGAAASTLRAEGFDGPLVLVGAETLPPYERPPLSKDYLRGDASVEDTLLRPESWYRESDVELVLGVRALAIDPAEGKVRLEGGGVIPYDKALLATGGENRLLDVPGRDLDGVLSLRTVEDADRIRERALPGTRAVVVGAGFIGCEVTATLREMGVEVEVIEIFDVPLERALGREVGAVVEGIHRDHGARFHFGGSVQRIVGDGRVEAVVTDGGERIDCDFVVVGIGIRPATDLVAATRVEIQNGIVVDEFCQTSVPGVFAAGDVANHFHPLFRSRVRVEHWDNAIKQGAAAAHSMLGRRVPFDDLHWFWSDQYGHNLQFIGFAPQWDELVVRGRLDDRRFVAFYLLEGTVRAAVSIDRGKELRRAAGLIQSSRPVDRDLLRDEDVDLRKLAREGDSP